MVYNCYDVAENINSNIMLGEIPRTPEVNMEQELDHHAEYMGKMSRAILKHYVVGTLTREALIEQIGLHVIACADSIDKYYPARHNRITPEMKQQYKAKGYDIKE